MSVEHVQTKREIEAALAATGLRPRKRFGQHFLIDGNLMRRLVESAEIDADDMILEVGGGTGGLTDLLVRRAKQVLCVEIDRDLQSILETRFRERPGFALIRGDVLRDKHHLAEEVAEALRAAPKTKLVANLPYQTATPLIMDLLLDYPQVTRLCFTVQTEVGERILAAPGGKDYGPLAIVAGILAEGREIARLAPSVFWPRPSVESVMIRLDVRTQPPIADRPTLHRFARFIRHGFEHRRKILHTSLAFHHDVARLQAACPAVDFRRRPEQVTAGEWLTLFKAADAASSD